jgi:predicted transcriptional regulator
LRLLRIGVTLGVQVCFLNPIVGSMVKLKEKLLAQITRLSEAPVDRGAAELLEASVYVLSDAQLRAVRAGEADIVAGRVLTDEEVNRVAVEWLAGGGRTIEYLEEQWTEKELRNLNAVAQYPDLIHVI